MPDVIINAAEAGLTGPIRIHVETTATTAFCAGCGSLAWSKDRPVVELVDLPCFGRPVRLVWRKRRWRCPHTWCRVGSWTEHAPTIAPARSAMTDRAGRWATAQVGRDGRSVAGVARDLGCDWHTIMDVVTAYGTPLIEDPNRIGKVTALGLDETLFRHTGQFNTREWATSIVDVNSPVQLLDMVEGRTAQPAIDWLQARPQDWRGTIVWGALDMSGPYRKVFNEALPQARQVADRFHVIKAGNEKLDVCRRRVQNETHGRHGRKDDPLYRGRRLFTKAHERLDEKGEAKLMGFLEAGDPRGELRLMWHAKEVLRGFYDLDDPTAA
ncbi:MAG: ISL3 family transposase, partial [Microthrixaceae bacterium]|nr:ISL3 family transposase [Microthrixaceae bacterium]